MGRKVLFGLILLFIAGGIFFMLPETSSPAVENGYQPLFEIMEISGAEITGGEFQYWASLQQKESRGLSGRQDLETLADDLVFKLIGSVPEVESGRIKARAAGVDAVSSCEGAGDEALPGYGKNLPVQREGRFRSGAEMKLLLQSLDQEGREVVHLLLIVKGEEPRGLTELAKRVTALLDAGMAESTLSFCLSGKIPGKMKPDEMEELAYSLVREIGGKQGQGIRDGQMVSVTGYYPELGEYFQAGEERLNLNIALRSDNLAGDTLIWAGTPLISSWY